MDTVISLRTQPVHRRIDINTFELQPADTFIQATPGELKLVNMFRELTEREKNEALTKVTAICKESRRVRENDAERERKRNRVSI